MDPVALLAGTRLFRGVASDRLERLRAELRSQTYARGAYIFHEGDAGNRLFAIADGQVKISRLRPGGEEAVFSILVAGDVFGELAIFDGGGERTADAQAIEPTDCVTLRSDALLQFLREQPELMLQLLGDLSAYIRRRDEAYAETAFLDIPGRVARILLDLADAHGRVSPQGTRIGVRLSQRALAGMVGASRENVNRALGAFAGRGSILVEAGTITIVDRAALAKRGGGG